MADEGFLVPRAARDLARKIGVARRELNNLRREVNSMKNMFIQKFKEVKELIEKGKLENKTVCTSDSCEMHASGKNMQGQRNQEHKVSNSDMKPIGYVESCFMEKNGIPRQPSVCPSAKAKLCVTVEGFTNPEHSLEGLEKFSHVWVIFLFHKNTNKAIKAKVKPPRLDGAKVGVFASRSPHRPNPIGLTLAKLDGIICNTLLLSGIDLLDGTPVLDIKPYVPVYDHPLAANSKGKSETESSNITLSNSKDVLQMQETDNQLSLKSVDEQINQCRETPGVENVESKAGSTIIAEWITNPPIKELNVKFSAEAAVQINHFHGNLSLEEDCQPSDLEGDANNSLQLKGCNCTSKPEELLKSFPCKRIDWNKTDNQSIVCSERENLKRNEQAIERDCSDAEEFSVDGKGVEMIENTKDCVLEVNENVEEKICGASTSLCHWEVHQSLGTCIYQLKMLSSPEEAKQAITDILKADPRSVYRRNHCQDQLYRFSIDTMNITCKFENSMVEVFQVEPVYFRELDRNYED